MSQAGVPKTIYLDLKGKARWVNVGHPDEFGKWGCVLWLTTESVETFNKLKSGYYEDVEGIKNELKKDEDGYFCRLSRPQKKETRNKTINFGPPLLLKADGESPYINTLVGNGSDVTCGMEVYFFKTPSKKIGSAMRLQSIRVDNLIPYEGSRDMTDKEAKLARSVQEAAPPTF